MSGTKVMAQKPVVRKTTEKACLPLAASAARNNLR